mgnify:CR=1 FL=1
MNYLSVENISKSYGEKVLFEDISFGINKDQKVAFVAKNGSGKTSILNIIANLDVPDSGQVVSRKGISIAYLAQKDDINPDLTIEETIFATDNKILSIVNQYEKALKNIENGDAYQAAFDLMDQHNAWDFETQYRQILSKLKLEDLSLKVGSLSGGQKKRLSLAIVLINKPDLLILDEPTNHLDLEMIEWLEAYFAKEKITLFMVTHDRYFLERVCDEILELDEGKIYKYKGNYSYYLQNKEERLALEATNLGKAKSLFKKELEWMRKQPKARTTKSKSRIDDFHQIKDKAHQRRIDHKVQLEINMERLGSKILELHKLQKSFGDKVILGKSSFLNIITEKAPVDGGKVVVGETIKFGYYTQSGITIKPGQKVIEVVKEFGEFIPLTKGRKISASQLLERFLFDKKKQYDFVEKLSGGEQKRLYLCAVLIQNPNFLILDEPTNDLDVVTLNVLESFLLDYPGNLLVVSHDRYFMDKIVDALFVFRGEGVVENFPGNYSDFRAYENSNEAEEAPVEKVIEKKVEEKKKSKNTLSFDEKREFGSLEVEIERLQKRKLTIENQFLNVEIDADDIPKKSEELQEIANELEKKEERWLELSMMQED